MRKFILAAIIFFGAIATSHGAGTLFIEGVEYNAVGQQTKIEFGNGDTTTNTYDPLTNRLTRIVTISGANIKIQDLSYQYDSAGNITKISDEAMPSGTQRFTYDELGRLITATGNHYGEKVYAYDKIGNIIQKDGKTFFYGEAAGPHAVTRTSDGVTYTYDANGNMASQQNADVLFQYFWDTENNLVKIRRNGAEFSNFAYDDNRERTVRLVNGVTNSVFVGGLSEENGLPGHPASTKINVIFLGSQRVASIVNGVVLYYHNDHLGGANVVTNQSGAVREVTEYAPFGEIASQDRYGTPEETARWYFSGHYFDKEANLIYMGARYYSPTLGRFLSPDTIIEDPLNPQTLNRYTYAGNNPVNNVDLDGHGFWRKIGEWFKKTAAIAAAVLFTLVGMPFIGAIIASAINTAIYGGGFKDFAIGVGVGIAAGYAGGFGAGRIGAVFGMERAGLSMAMMRGGLSGGIAGAGGAAIYHGDIGRSALLGAGVGATMGAAFWKSYDTTTDKFLERVQWNENVSDVQRSTITQAFRQYGQSPVGNRWMNKYLSSGEGMEFHSQPRGIAHAEGTKMGIRKMGISMFRNGDARAHNSSIDWDVVVSHEFTHLAPNGGFDDPLNVSMSENLYRSWIGIQKAEVYGSKPVPDTKGWFYRN